MPLSSLQQSCTMSSEKVFSVWGEGYTLLSQGEKKRIIFASKGAIGQWGGMFLNPQIKKKEQSADGQKKKKKFEGLFSAKRQDEEEIHPLGDADLAKQRVEPVRLHRGKNGAAAGASICNILGGGKEGGNQETLGKKKPVSFLERKKKKEKVIAGENCGLHRQCKCFCVI